MLRLNLGSGRHPWPNAVNIDHDPRADLQAPVEKLPFSGGSVDEIYAIHLFEHLHREEAPAILKEWVRTLKIGGKLVIEAPCLDKIAAMIVAGDEKREHTLYGIFGDVREPSPYMRHQWCYTAKELTTLMNEAGLEAEVSEPIYHLPKRDMRVTGVKK